MTPVLKCVSNVNPGGVGPRFTLIGQDVVEGRRSAVHAVGQDLTAGEFAGVNRAVEKLCATGRDTARAIAQVLTETIRAVAKSADRRAYVSDDVLVTSLPRPDLLRDQLVVGKLVEDYWSVTNIPGGDSRKERHGGPVIVGHKAAVQALPPEDGPPIGALGTFSGVRLVRVPESDRSLVMYVLTDPPLGAAWGWPG
jgi:hypothetical protein